MTAATEERTEFSLRAIVREVLAEDTSEDLRQIAKEVERRVPAGLAVAALSQALPTFIREALRFAEWRAQGAATGRRKDPAPPQPSAKVTSIREAWRRHLETVRYTVADGSSRRLGDLSRNDVLFLSGKLDRQARDKKTRAMGMKAVAAAMSEHAAAQVRDLPVDYLREMFGGPRA